MNTKQVIQLDAAGYFVGFTTADESPLEPGVFLLPGGAVDVPAPSIPVGKRAKWLGEWVFEDIPPPPEPDPVPEPEPEVPTCSPWQIRKALNQAGLRQQVEDLVAASTDQAVKDGWEYATEFRADDAFVLTMGAAFSMDATQICAFIENASYL